MHYLAKSRLSLFMGIVVWAGILLRASISDLHRRSTARIIIPFNRYDTITIVDTQLALSTLLFSLIALCGAVLACQAIASWDGNNPSKFDHSIAVAGIMCSFSALIPGVVEFIISAMSGIC